MGQYDAKLMKIYDKRATLPHLLYQKRAEKRRYAISRPQAIGIIRYHVGTHVHYHSGARKDIHQARSSPSRRAQKQFRNRPFLSILIQYSFNTHSIPYKESRDGGFGISPWGFSCHEIPYCSPFNPLITTPLPCLLSIFLS